MADTGSSQEAVSTNEGNSIKFVISFLMYLYLLQKYTSKLKTGPPKLIIYGQVYKYLILRCRYLWIPALH